MPRIIFIPQELNPRHHALENTRTNTTFNLRMDDFPPLPPPRNTLQEMRRARNVFTASRTPEYVIDLDISRLLLLPTEIQEHIFEHYLYGQFRHFDIDVYTNNPMLSSTPSNFTLLPALIADFGPILQNVLRSTFLRNCTFSVRSHRANRWFRAWLQQVLPQNRGYASIREMQFHSFHHFPGIGKQGRDGQMLTSNADVELMRACTGLRKTLISIHIGAVIHRRHRPAQPKTHKEIMDHFGLEGLFSCTTLREITITGIDNDHITSRCTVDPVDVLEGFATWFKEEWRKRNLRSVKVFVTWRCGRFSGNDDTQSI